MAIFTIMEVRKARDYRSEILAWVEVPNHFDLSYCHIQAESWGAASAIWDQETPRGTDIRDSIVMVFCIAKSEDRMKRCKSSKDERIHCADFVRWEHVQTRSYWDNDFGERRTATWKKIALLAN